MQKLLLEGMEDLLVGLGIPILLATGAALFHVVFGGWKGFRHFLMLWATGVVVSVLAHWACQYFKVTGTASAVIIGTAALFSFTIISTLFHPDVKQALLKRVTFELRTRGIKGKGHGGQAD